eukprot:4941720-Prymnesium_polylepis.1
MMHASMGSRRMAAAQPLAATTCSRSVSATKAYPPTSSSATARALCVGSRINSRQSSVRQPPCATERPSCSRVWPEKRSVIVVAESAAWSVSSPCESSAAAVKSTMTITSVHMVTDSTCCVNGPSARCSDTTAIADEGERPIETTAARPATTSCSSSPSRERPGSAALPPKLRRSGSAVPATHTREASKSIADTQQMARKF